MDNLRGFLLNRYLQWLVTRVANIFFQLERTISIMETFYILMESNLPIFSFGNSGFFSFFLMKDYTCPLCAIWGNTNEAGGHYAKLKKPVMEGQALHDSTYMRNSKMVKPIEAENGMMVARGSWGGGIIQVDNRYVQNSSYAGVNKF